MQQLKEVIQSFNRIYIQTHNFPDADAIASAFGMKNLVEILGKEAEIIYFGSNIFKSNISKLLDKYSIKMTIIGDGFKIADDELLIIVDGQYNCGNVKKVTAKNIAVIDHHLKESHYNYIYEDIQPRIGSCATLIYNYLKYYSLKIDSELATIIYYGIFMDTDMFTVKVTTVDDDARKELSESCDKKFIEHLRFSSLTFDDLKIYAAAIQKTERYNNIIFTFIDECDDNLLGHISDLLLEINDIDIVIVYSNRVNGYKLSIRSYHEYFTAEEFARELTKNIGSGGGNVNKAGGYVFSDKFDQEYRNMSFSIYLKTTIIDYFREVKLLRNGLHDPYEAYGLNKFFKAKKKKNFFRYIDIADYFEENVSVKTLEGLATATIEDKVIIGVKNEIWPISKETFNRKYLLVDNNSENCISDEYLDEYGIVIHSDSKIIKFTKENISQCKICQTSDNTVVHAVKLNEKVKIRTLWGDFLGKKGDYLIVNSKDDYYICDGDIFHKTYDVL